MNETVTIAFRSQYSDRVYQLVEQKGSRLMAAVTMKLIDHAEDAYFERLGSATVRRKTVRNSLSEPSDIPHSRRKMFMEDYYSEVWLDKEDELRMLIDPKSDYAMKQAAALGRQIDDLIIAAATGNATAVDDAYGTTTVALPSGQIVGEDIGASNSDLNVDKLLNTNRIFDQNDCEEGASRVIVYDAKAKEALLNTTEIGSRDFNSVYALVTGSVNSFCGFNFILSNRILGAGTEGDPRLVLAFEKEGIGLAMQRNITSRMVEDDQRHFMWKVYSSMSAAATRVEEERVVSIECVG